MSMHADVCVYTLYLLQAFTSPFKNVNSPLSKHTTDHSYLKLAFSTIFKYEEQDFKASNTSEPERCRLHYNQRTKRHKVYTTYT